MKHRRDSLALVSTTGLAAVVLYVGATILGGILDSRYSQLRNTISDLTATGAPNWIVLAPLYVAYSVLLFGFAVGIYRGSNRSRWLAVPVFLFALGALLGIGQVTAFREDLGGAPHTFSGIGHVVLAGASSLFTIAATAIYGFAFRHDPAWRPLSAISFAATLALLVSGPVAAVNVTGQYAGLFERITIGVFIAWVAVLSGYAAWKGVPTSGTAEQGASRRPLFSYRA